MTKFLGLILLLVGLTALFWGGWHLLHLLLRLFDHDGLSGHKSWMLALRGVLGVGAAVLLLPRAAKLMRS